MRKSSFRNRCSGLVLALLLLPCGCSFVFSSPPPGGAESSRARPQVDCSTSNVAPIVDSVLLSYELVRSGYALSASADTYRDYPISREADLALALGFSALFLGSAIYGYSAAARCGRVKSGPPSDAYQPGVSSEPAPSAYAVPR